MSTTTDHLAELIEEADAQGDVRYDQPAGAYVGEAEDEFRAAGFSVSERDAEENDDRQVPWGAIAMRAHEIHAAEEAEE